MEGKNKKNKDSDTLDPFKPNEMSGRSNSMLRLKLPSISQEEYDKLKANFSKNAIPIPSSSHPYDLRKSGSRIKLPSKKNHVGKFDA